MVRQQNNIHCLASCPGSSLDASTVFVLELAAALHSSGAPAHRLEDAVGAAAQALGTPAQVYATPTALFAELGSRGTHMVRAKPGEVALDRLIHIDGILERVIAGETSAEEGASELRAADEALGASPAALKVAAFGLASAAAAVLLGGRAGEIIVSGALGLGIGGLSLAAARWPGLGRLFEPAAALSATFFAALAQTIGLCGSREITALAALIVLVPGLTLTIALTELATRHLVSGTARMAAALTTFMMIGLGVALGGALGALLHPPESVAGPPLHALWTWLAVAVAPLAFAVLLRAPRSELGWIVAATLLTWAAASLGASTGQAELGAAAGAFAAGALGNLYARALRRPAIVLIVPAILILVPGSVGFRAVGMLLADEVLVGVEQAFTTAILAVALVGGLLLSQALVSPRRTL